MSGSITVQADPAPNYTEYAIAFVRAERRRQDQKWGEQNHDYPVWRVILDEENGEASREWLEAHFTGLIPEHDDDFLEESIQVAAVALAMVENIIKRREGRLPLNEDSHAPNSFTRS